MNTIYEPKGKAGEYSPLAVNLHDGCMHGCRYCFAPAVRRKTRINFYSNAAPRKDILKKLEIDASKLQGDTREILISFITDPYQIVEVEQGITRDACKILNKYGLHFTILTKGGTRAARDFDILQKSYATFGTTLVSMDQSFVDYHEPNAASINDRIEAIRKAKSMGIPTWISLEPVIEPTQALQVIKCLHPIVDHWKVGKINYSKTNVDWKQFRRDVRMLLNRVGANYYLKKSLTNIK